MIEETLQELVNAVDNLSDNKVRFQEETDMTFDWIATSLDRIADTLEKIEAKMK